MIFNNLITELKHFSLIDYPKEACGLILKDFTYIPSKNMSFYPKHSFIIDPYLINKHIDNIWGIFHSHPGDKNPIPSEKDLQHTVFDEFKFIVGFDNKFFIYWVEKGILKYEPFTENHCKI